MLLNKFVTFVYSPVEFGNIDLATASTYAGGIGVINAEFKNDDPQTFKLLDSLESQDGARKYGLKLSSINAAFLKRLQLYINNNLGWLILDSAIADDTETYPVVSLDLASAGSLVFAGGTMLMSTSLLFTVSALA